MDFLRDNPVASLLVVIIAIAGAVVTILNPDTLPFNDYVQSVMVGAGLLAVGRGIRSHGQPEVRKLPEPKRRTY